MRNYNIKFTVLSLFILLITKSIFAESGYAKIAIINFVNETKSNNYDYLGSTISSAINKSMKVTFNFDRPRVSEIQSFGERLLPSSKYFTLKDLKAFSDIAKVDYIIYGNYVLKARNKILIKAVMFISEDREIIAKVSNTIETDSSMFKNIDDISKKLVAAIKIYVIKHKKNKIKNRITIKGEGSEPIKVVQAKKNYKYGMGGCGVGSNIAGAKPDKAMQIVASIVNTYFFSSQSAGITSGTSNCTDAGVVKADMEQRIFMAANFENIEKEIVKGGGENVNTIAYLMGCSKNSTNNFTKVIQHNYSLIFKLRQNGENGYRWIHYRIKKVVAADGNLSSSCKKIWL